MTLSLPHKFSLFLLFLVAFLLFSHLSARSVKAVSVTVPKVTIKNSKFAATLVKQSDSDPVEIVVGKSKTVVFTFKNTGSVTWDSAGKGFISAYTVEPRDRASIFANKDWKSTHQTGRLPGKIKPGKTGELAITFKAPTKPGEYIEKFYLASENHSWVKNGYFFVKIKVVAAPTSGASVKQPVVEPPKVETVNRVFLNPKQITAAGGDTVTVRFAYQNMGKTDWTSLVITANGAVNMADANWTDAIRVLQKNITITPNDFARDSFTMRAPLKADVHTASFTVAFNGNQTALITIPITVTADAPPGIQEFFASAPISPVNPAVDLLNEMPRLAMEPTIRVGLWKNPDNNTVRFISADDEYNLYAGVNLLGTLPKSTPATLTFFDGVYSLNSDLFSTSSAQYLRLVPTNSTRSIFTLTNFSRPYSGRAGVNFNQYRGSFELRLAQDQGKSLYGINELLFEDYMAGIGENSNVSPIEYLKAQTVAQRTYAYYTQQNTGKHDSRNFDVVAHTGDQLYLGAANEPYMSRFLNAATDTRGVMVTYNNNVVVTPYYGNSDGRTRSWAEVWGGNKPWLVSVPATYDARDNKKMFGHGVGMSQRDAAYRADEEKLDWVQLLKYYYTGTEVHKIY